MQNEFTKELHTTKCERCGAIIDISESGVVQRMIVQHKELQEDCASLRKGLRNNRLQRIGQIQVMHKIIKRLLDLMTPEQRVKAKEINQVMREALKNIENKVQT